MSQCGIQHTLPQQYHLHKSKKVIKMRLQHLYYHERNKFTLCSRPYTDRKCQMQMNFWIYQESEETVPPHSDASEFYPQNQGKTFLFIR